MFRGKSEWATRAAQPAPGCGTGPLETNVAMYPAFASALGGHAGSVVDSC